MDMLVKLYALPDSRDLFDGLRRQRVEIRRALSAEKHKIVAWVRENFSEAWASETEVAFGRQPVSCFVAIKTGHIAGFACHDVTCRNFFGPTGVAPAARNNGIGTALLFAASRPCEIRGSATRSSAAWAPRPIMPRPLARSRSRARSRACMLACSIVPGSDFQTSDWTEAARPHLRFDSDVACASAPPHPPRRRLTMPQATASAQLARRAGTEHDPWRLLQLPAGCLRPAVCVRETCH